MDLDARVLVVGQCGWVGNAVARRLWAAGFNDLMVVDRSMWGLARQATVDALFAREQPQYVFLVAARDGDGGLRPDDAIREGLAVQASVIHAAWRAGVRKLCFMASSAIYPTDALPPANEGALLTAWLRPGNDSRSIVQIAGIRLCQVYRRQYRFDAVSLVPAMLYGHGDSEDAQSSRLAALIKRLHEARVDAAREIHVGALRSGEFLQVDDFADAALFAMREYSGEVPINVGTGEPVTADQLARLAAEVVGYRGRVVHSSDPAPAPRDFPDTRLHDMGWEPCMSLRQGLGQTYAWLLQRRAEMLA